MLSYSRYKPVGECTNYKEACQKIYECGYATDPEYPKKLISIIEENRLNDFDSINETKIDEKIRKFQKLCNNLSIKDIEGKTLVEDNLIGWRTPSCIGSLPVLKVGSLGKVVKFIQEIVGAVPVDGDFGPITKQCVTEYQKNKNITADGIVGMETWTTIITT